MIVVFTIGGQKEAGVSAIIGVRVFHASALLKEVQVFGG